MQKGRGRQAYEGHASCSCGVRRAFDFAQQSLRSVRLLLLCFIGLSYVASTNAAPAPETVVAGSLERWLQTEVLPPLAEVLSNHPRFKGETIRVANLTAGRPHPVSDQLTEALASELTHGLLRASSVRIAWQEQASTGCTLPRDLPYLLGVEVSRKGARGYQVSLAMIDVEESVWIAGASYRYEGRLTAAQHKAINTPVKTAAAGSVTSPLRLGSHELIAGQLANQIQCRGIDGDLFIETQGHSVFAPIVVEMQRQLARRASFTLVNEATDADWVMHLALRQIDGAGHELVAVLASGHDADVNSQQRLAAVFVTPTAGEIAQLNPAADSSKPAATSNLANPNPSNTPTAAAPSVVDTPEQDVPVAGYISSLKKVRPEPDSRCRKRRNQCIEVEVELKQPSYLVLFHTTHDGLAGHISVGGCGREASLAEPGVKRYRVGVINDQASVYVVATPDLQVAQQLHRQLAAGDRKCGGQQTAPGWLATTRQLLDDFSPRLDWQVVRVGQVVGVNAPAEVATLVQRRR